MRTLLRPVLSSVATILTIFWASCLAQERVEPKPAVVEAIPAAKLEELLNARLDGGLQFSFRQFANMFLVSSSIKLGTGVGLMTESDEVAECELQPIYSENYRPTLKQFMDRIALQTSSTWKHDPSGKFIENEAGGEDAVKGIVIFEFTENQKAQKPYEIKLEEGWKTVDYGHWVMHKPAVFPIGMDVYQLGCYTPEDGKPTPEFIQKMRADIALGWAQRVRPETESKEMAAAKVGDYDALYFECMIPSQMNKEIKWRQWVFFVDDEAYFIVSTIFPEFEDKIFPDVKKMIASFKKREIKEGAGVVADPKSKPQEE